MYLDENKSVPFFYLAELGRRQADPTVLGMALRYQTAVCIPGNRDIPDFDILLVTKFGAVTSDTLGIAGELDLRVSATAKPKARYLARRCTTATTSMAPSATVACLGFCVSDHGSTDRYHIEPSRFIGNANLPSAVFIRDDIRALG